MKPHVFHTLISMEPRFERRTIMLKRQLKAGDEIELDGTWHRVTFRECADPCNCFIIEKVS